MRESVLRGALRKIRKWTTLSYVEDLALEEWEASRIKGSDFRPLQLDRDGALRAHRVSEETLALVCAEVPVVGSRYDLYKPPKSPALVASLVADGVITNEELPCLTSHDGCLNHKGVKLLTAALRGLVVADYELVKQTPGFVMPRIDWSIWQLARLKTMGRDWDVSPLVEKALCQMHTARAEGFQLDDLSTCFAHSPARSSKASAPDRMHKGVEIMAITLAGATVDEALSRFTLLAQLAVESCADSLPSVSSVRNGAPRYGANVPTPLQTAKDRAKTSFATAFLLPLATVGSMFLADFRPGEHPLHEAIQWAFDNTRTHCIEDALRILEREAGDRARSQQRLELLRTLEGFVDIYDAPRLGEAFSCDSTRGDTLLCSERMSSVDAG